MGSYLKVSLNPQRNVLRLTYERQTTAINGAQCLLFYYWLAFIRDSGPALEKNGSPYVMKWSHSTARLFAVWWEGFFIPNVAYGYYVQSCLDGFINKRLFIEEDKVEGCAVSTRNELRKSDNFIRIKLVDKGIEDSLCLMINNRKINQGLDVAFSSNPANNFLKWVVAQFICDLPFLLPSLVETDTGDVRWMLHPYRILALYSHWSSLLELICYNHRHDFHAY